MLINYSIARPFLLLIPVIIAVLLYVTINRPDLIGDKLGPDPIKFLTNVGLILFIIGGLLASYNAYP